MCCRLGQCNGRTPLKTHQAVGQNRRTSLLRSSTCQTSGMVSSRLLQHLPTLLCITAEKSGRRRSGGRPTVRPACCRGARTPDCELRAKPADREHAPDAIDAAVVRLQELVGA